MGYCHGCAHGEYRSSLCVPLCSLLLVNIQGLLRLDAYANDCFPNHQGEISALLNLARTLGGFSVAYFQVPWATKRGPLEVLGCEAAYVIFLEYDHYLFLTLMML